MICAALAHLLGLLIDLATCTWRSDREKDLEILLLRRQLAILQRTQPRPPRLTRWERLGLAVLAVKLSRLSAHGRQRLRESLLLWKPETVLGWHRALVRRKWTFHHRPAPGRPPITTEMERLILRLAAENPRWGYKRIQGELHKLGYRVARATISAVLKRHHIPPAPSRGRGGSWRAFLRHYRQPVLACDFFALEMVWSQSIISSSRVA